MKIHPNYKGKVTTQNYNSSSKRAIEGVEVVTGKFHRDCAGSFAEIVRINSKGNVEALEKPFKVRQISFSLVYPGSIKAYHLHYHQDDVWFVPPQERLLVNLHDVRKDSPTFDYHQRFIAGGGKNMIVRIPKGVAHGVANLYHRPMNLIYATDQQFNPKDPDEHRLPWDLFGQEVWEMVKG